MDAEQNAAPAESQGEYIKLDQFLKLANIVETGGQAKLLILDGQVRVNGHIEKRRGCKLRTGDVVQVGDEKLVIEFE